MKIALLGCGVVGSGVRAIIDAKESRNTAALEIKKILVKDENEIDDPRRTTDFNEIVNDPEIELVAEMMGGLEPAHSYVKAALEAGKHVITSNKKMLASFYPELAAAAAANNRCLAYEASTGGGIPWIANLGRVAREENIESFSGIMNGTTNYILSRMTSEGKDFAELLAEAQKLGYAEADPTDDIDGYDVRYKCCISAVRAFNTYVSPEEIPAYGIRNIGMQDMEYCKKNGLVCKLIGHGALVKNADGSKAIDIGVVPSFIPADSMMAGISLNFNALQCVSHNLGAATFVGQGAGSLPTAHAVVQDMIDVMLAEEERAEEVRTLPVSTESLHNFYIRPSKLTAFGALITKTVGSGAFIASGISFARLKEIVEQANDNNVFIAEIL